MTVSLLSSIVHLAGYYMYNVFSVSQKPNRHLIGFPAMAPHSRMYANHFCQKYAEPARGIVKPEALKKLTPLA